MRKLRLSDTQAHVIGAASCDQYGWRKVWTLGRSRSTTFAALHRMGLTTTPHAGAILTAEGLNVWAALSYDSLRREFSAMDVISHSPHGTGRAVPTSIMARNDQTGEVIEYAYVPNGDMKRVQEFCDAAQSFPHFSNVHIVHHLIENDESRVVESETPKKFMITEFRDRMGQEHIHKAGCADIKRMISRGEVMNGPDSVYTYEITSVENLATEYWGDIAGDTTEDGSPEWLAECMSLADGMTWHNCVTGLNIPRH